jgi:hypothetical protein
MLTDRRLWFSAVGVALVAALACLLLAFAPSGATGVQPPTAQKVPTLSLREILIPSANSGSTGATIGPGIAPALAAATWSTIPAGPLSARAEQSTLWTGSDMLIWGGQSLSTQVECPCETHSLNDGSFYDPKSSQWTTMPPSPLSAREDAASVWTGHLALFWGGQTASTYSSSPLSNGASYNPSTNRWELLPKSPLTPRSGVTALWTGTVAIFIGGQGPPSTTPQSTFNGTEIDGATYNPTTRKWIRLPPLPTKGLGTPYSITAAWTGRELITWSSFELTIPTASCGVQLPASCGGLSRNDTLGAEWAPGQKSWRRLPSPPTSVFTVNATSTWLNGRDVLTGGTACFGGMSCPATLTGAAQIFNPVGNTWQSSPSAPIFIRPDLVESTGASLVLIDENSEIGLSFNPGDAFVFDPTTNKVRALPPVPAGTIGPSSSLVWTGHRLLMWGATGDSTKTFGLQLSGK